MSNQIHQLLIQLSTFWGPLQKLSRTFWVFLQFMTISRPALNSRPVQEPRSKMTVSTHPLQSNFLKFPHANISLLWWSGVGKWKRLIDIVRCRTWGRSSVLRGRSGACYHQLLLMLVRYGFGCDCWQLPTQPVQSTAITHPCLTHFDEVGFKLSRHYSAGDDAAQWLANPRRWN